MGHLVNPISWRLGKNIYWKSLYYINDLDFAYNNINDINLFIFLNKFFKNKFFKVSGFYISNFKILKFFSGTFVYALLKSYNYSYGGLFKYSKRRILNKLISGKSAGKRYKKKKVIKIVDYILPTKRPVKLLTNHFIKRTPSELSIRLRHIREKPRKKPDPKNVYTMFLELSGLGEIAKNVKKRLLPGGIPKREIFKKIIGVSAFISKKIDAASGKSRSKNKIFSNYSNYINNFKKRVIYINRREREYSVISAILRRLKFFFLIKSFNKNLKRNIVFNNYFFKNPLNYFKKKSYLLETTKVSSGSLSTFRIYDCRKFFFFNILKLIPQGHLGLFKRYPYKEDAIFTKNKLKIRLSFYNNFLFIYRRFPLFSFVKNFLASFTNKFFNNVKFTFAFYSEKSISANLVKDFILSKIIQRFKVNRISFIVSRMLNGLFKENIIYGYKVFLAGRFSRKDRATFYWKKSGYLSFNNRMDTIDYSFGTKVLRYSLCICKVWLGN